MPLKITIGSNQCKLCSKCNIEKPLEDFSFRTDNQQYRKDCKKCHTASGVLWDRKNKNIRQNYYKIHAAQFRAYALANKARIRARQKQYNKIYVKHKKETDPLYKLARVLRTRLYCAIKNNQKVGSAVRDLGCSIEELKIYLEKQFKEGMTWDNWGRGNNKWHIDHIKPLAKFNLSEREQLLEAVHYTNLQPLWQFDNLSKHDKYDDPEVSVCL